MGIRHKRHCNRNLNRDQSVSPLEYPNQIITIVIDFVVLGGDLQNPNTTIMLLFTSVDNLIPLDLSLQCKVQATAAPLALPHATDALGAIGRLCTVDQDPR